MLERNESRGCTYVVGCPLCTRPSRYRQLRTRMSEVGLLDFPPGLLLRQSGDEI